MAQRFVEFITALAGRTSGRSGEKWVNETFDNCTSKK